VPAPRAVVIDAPNRLAIRRLDPQRPGRDEAVVRVAFAGICGSDQEIMRGTRPAGYVRYPIVPGHEWSGTVVTVGAGADPSLVGRAVVGEGFRSCQTCDPCRAGEGNLCSAGYDETGFTRQGAWASHLVVPARLLHVLPDGADLRAAAGLEPAAVVAAACRTAMAVPGERVAVVGGGMLGLLTVQMLRAASPAELVVIHPSDRRAELARRCGASRLVPVDDAAALAGRFDVVVEAAGAPGTARLAASIARRGGRVVLTGIAADDDRPLAPVDLVLNQITVHTVFGAPSRAWTHAVRAFAAGLVDPGVLVTHEFALDDVREAFRVLDERSDDVVKVLLRP